MLTPLTECTEKTANAFLEITPSTAVELVHLGLATLLDIRQPFELEMKGQIPSAIPLPFFNLKQSFGIALTEEEQEILDADEPNPSDARFFIKSINLLNKKNDTLLIAVCNSGKRSLCAAKLLREVGYGKTLSLAGGFIALAPWFAQLK